MRIWFKYIAYILFLLVAIILGYSMYQKQDPIWIIKGNYDMRPLNFELENTNDTISKMLIRDRENAAQAILANGDTYFFNDPGDIILWLKDKSVGANIKLWIYTIDTHRWIDAKIAWYGIRDKTVMGYGFGAREHRCKECISYEQMRLRMLHDETLLNPIVRKRLLENDYAK